MASNRGVAYMGPGKVEMHGIDFPKLALGNRKCEHGVILKIVSTNICGSDQHMVRGRTTAPKGLILGHEITGEVLEAGRDVEFIKVGDLVSVPFNIACGRCRNCKERATGICLNVNPARPGAAYGYVDMGGWVGGQAEYVMVPYADFNFSSFPKGSRDGEDQGPYLPVGYFADGISRRRYGRCGPGSTVYVAGAGPVGSGLRGGGPIARSGSRDRGRSDSRAAGAGAKFRMRNRGCFQGRFGGRADRANPEGDRKWIAPWIASDSRLAATATMRDGNAGHGAELADDNHPRGRRARHSGPLCNRRSWREGRKGQDRKPGHSHRPGLGKIARLHHRAMPGVKYNRQLMMAILHDKIQIAKAVNVTVVKLG